MKFIDDKSKNLKWWNRNYFYAGTIIVILVNILLFAYGGDDWESVFKVDYSEHWGDAFCFSSIIRSFFNAFSHSNWQHILLNMLCFLASGFYLERKRGSFGIVLIVLFGAFFASVATTANDLAVNWHGFSVVNYFLCAVVLVDYIFSFRSEERNKTNIIVGAIIVVFTYISMCFNGGVIEFSFEWYPYNLMYNMGHYSSFLIGIILSIIIQTTRLLSVKGKDSKTF